MNPQRIIQYSLTLSLKTRMVLAIDKSRALSKLGIYSKPWGLQLSRK